MKAAFSSCSHRPEVLSEALDDLELRDDVDATSIDNLLGAQVDLILARSKAQFMQIVESRPELQAAVLQTMAECLSAFAPYTQATFDRCKEICASRVRKPVTVDSTSVQYAFDALREKQLIWKSGRGVYSIEHTQHAAWLSGVPEEDQQAHFALAHAFRPRAPSDRGKGEGAWIRARRVPLSEMG